MSDMRLLYDGQPSPTHPPGFDPFMESCIESDPGAPPPVGMVEFHAGIGIGIGRQLGPNYTRRLLPGW